MITRAADFVWRNGPGLHRHRFAYQFRDGRRNPWWRHFVPTYNKHCVTREWLELATAYCWRVLPEARVELGPC